MRSRSFVIIGILTVVIALAWLAPITAGQAPNASTNASSNALSNASSKTWTPRRLSNGQPDIEGIYINQWVIPIERYTKEERDAFQKAIVAHRGPDLTASPGSNGAPGSNGSYGNEWFDRPGGGTSRPNNSPHPPGHVAVIDPPDGRIPWQPWALARKNYIRDHPFETRAVYDYRIRCLPAGTPRGTFFSYYNGWQIQQPPGQVVILYEHNHLYRVIRLDGSPLPDRTSSCGWATRSGAGRATRWSSTCGTSPARPGW